MRHARSHAKYTEIALGSLISYNYGNRRDYRYSYRVCRYRYVAIISAIYGYCSRFNHYMRSRQINRASPLYTYREKNGGEESRSFRILYFPEVREKQIPDKRQRHTGRGGKKLYQSLAPLELVGAIVARHPIIKRVFPDEMAFVRFAFYRAPVGAARRKIAGKITGHLSARIYLQPLARTRYNNITAAVVVVAAAT